MRNALLLLLFAWQVPHTSFVVDFIDCDPTSDGRYGSHVIVRRASGEIVFDGGPMMDADFFTPKFFRDGTQTLMLADYGSEDVWGIFAIAFDGTRIRPLGTLDLAAPEDEAGFTSSAVDRVTARLDSGHWLLTFQGPLLVDPRGEGERAVEGEVVFREVDGKFALTASSTD